VYSCREPRRQDGSRADEEERGAHRAEHRGARGEARLQARGRSARLDPCVLLPAFQHDEEKDEVKQDERAVHEQAPCNLMAIDQARSERPLRGVRDQRLPIQERLCRVAGCDHQKGGRGASAGWT
jgi:hypothetical protein